MQPDNQSTTSYLQRRTFVVPPLWYDLRTMRRISYKTALTALFFVGAWFVLGFLFLMTPIPGALGIGSALFQAWIVVFIIALGLGGAMLTMASFNGLFPRVVKPPKRRAAPTTTTTRTTSSWQQTTTSTRRDH